MLTAGKGNVANMCMHSLGCIAVQWITILVVVIIYLMKLHEVILNIITDCLKSLYDIVFVIQKILIELKKKLHMFILVIF